MSNAQMLSEKNQQHVERSPKSASSSYLNVPVKKLPTTQVEKKSNAATSKLICQSCKSTVLQCIICGMIHLNLKILQTWKLSMVLIHIHLAHARQNHCSTKPHHHDEFSPGFEVSLCFRKSMNVLMGLLTM